MSIRFARYSASSANSTAAARWPSVVRVEALLDLGDRRHFGHRGQHFSRRHPLAGGDRRTVLDRDHQRSDVDAAEQPLCGVGGGAAQQVFEHRLLAALFAGLELQLAAQHVDHRGQVHHPGHRILLAQHGGAVPGGRGDRLGGRDREPRRHTRALVDRPRLAQVAGEPGEHLQQILGHLGGQVRLLVDDADLGLELAAGSGCGSRRRTGP